MQIVSKYDAKRLGLNRYYTGKLCKHNHDSERYTNCGQCVECTRVYRHKNIDEISIREKKYKLANMDKIIAYRKSYGREYYLNNRNKFLKGSRKYYNKNKDKHKALCQKFHRENKGKAAQYSATRRASLRSLTPVLSTEERRSMGKLYESAKSLGSLTGRVFHVDHIWPLALGGVHHPCNLQILESTTNIRKSASHDGVSGVSYEDFMLAVSAYA